MLMHEKPCLIPILIFAFGSLGLLCFVNFWTFLDSYFSQKPFLLKALKNQRTKETSTRGNRIGIGHAVEADTLSKALALTKRDKLKSKLTSSFDAFVCMFIIKIKKFV